MQPPASEQIIVQGSGFADWTSLNDTIMGGASRAGCRVTDQGLMLEGEVERVIDLLVPPYIPSSLICLCWFIVIELSSVID
jgi:hypothetical protein